MTGENGKRAETRGRCLVRRTWPETKVVTPPPPPSGTTGTVENVDRMTEGEGPPGPEENVCDTGFTVGTGRDVDTQTPLKTPTRVTPDSPRVGGSPSGC